MKKIVNSIHPVSINKLIIIVALFIMLFHNIAFFSNLLNVYPLTPGNAGYLVSVAWFFTAINVLFLSMISFRFTVKPVLIFLLILSSFTGYFMDSYNTVIDMAMIHNTLHTDTAEALDLFSYKLMLYVVLTGLIPSYFVYKSTLTTGPVRQELIARFKLFSLALISMLVVLFISSSFFSSFFREHKQLRYYANPGFTLYSSVKYLHSQLESNSESIKQIGLQAKTPLTDPDRELIIFVVGETARADRFSLNGYSRETNPLLHKENVVSFTDFWSCGTSTAISVPCMFSIYTTTEFDIEKGSATENVLDVLKHAGVNLLWLDNNSSSKGVADRIDYLSYKEVGMNSECDIECRDVGMLTHLQNYIDEHPEGDIFIVLHQMGQHGPAYYKRYPADFERFTPVCKTNQLENCSDEELNNAYDNAILYTDYFLSKVIQLLKHNDEGFETAMLYVSDHGESLGENGMYLHGLPNFIAPDAQRHVPAIVWIGQNMHDIDLKQVARVKHKTYSHDNIFHTILGLLETQSSPYDKNMDILYHTRVYE